jgi:hypothetical protein
MTGTTPAAHAGGPPGYTGHKADHLARLTRIEGQIRGVARMVEDDRYCTGVLTQISGITREWQEVALGLLDALRDRRRPHPGRRGRAEGGGTHRGGSPPGPRLTPALAADTNHWPRRRGWASAGATVTKEVPDGYRDSSSCHPTYAR